MIILVVGATGATGRLLVQHLLDNGQVVRAIVRSTHNLPDALKSHDNLSLIQASISDLNDEALAKHVEGCHAVVSCLGHNMHWKGIYGKPRKLVADATRRLCTAINTHQVEKPVKFILMNTTGNRNGDLNEPISFGEKCVIGMLRLLLPPHVDNEKAAGFLRTKIGQNNDTIEWVAVRPDSLVNHETVTNYELHNSPIRSTIFNSGQTSRINVGHFMTKLIIDEDIWKAWKGKMPVIYNKDAINK